MSLTFKSLYKQRYADTYYARPNTYKGEGEDHINISVSSKLKLGRMFDPGYCCNFEYPHIGLFKSVLTLGYWLRSKDLDDSIRMLKGNTLKQYIADHRDSFRRIPNYAAIVAKATWIRIKDRPDILEEIKLLPDHLVVLSYHIRQPGGLRITTAYAPFIVPIVNEIIHAVKTNSEPDFDQFVSDHRVTGSDYLEGVLRRYVK